MEVQLLLDPSCLTVGRLVGRHIFLKGQEVPCFCRSTCLESLEPGRRNGIHFPGTRNGILEYEKSNSRELLNKGVKVPWLNTIIGQGLLGMVARRINGGREGEERGGR